MHGADYRVHDSRNFSLRLESIVRIVLQSTKFVRPTPTSAVAFGPQNDHANALARLTSSKMFCLPALPMSAESPPTFCVKGMRASPYEIYAVSMISSLSYTDDKLIVVARPFQLLELGNWGDHTVALRQRMLACHSHISSYTTLPFERASTTSASLRIVCLCKSHAGGRFYNLCIFGKRCSTS